MKSVFGRILLCVTALAGVVACGESLQPAHSGSGPATVVAYMPGESGQYALQKFELIGITDIKEVAGRFVSFFISPRISKIDGKEKMEGLAPRAQYIRNSAGNYVASDSLTIELFSIYAHLQNLAALDVELGAEGVNSWPRDVGVAVRAEGGMVNNAQYYGPADVMYFVRYTKSDLPIQVNAGVIAHEHFHSLFYKLVPAPEAARTSVHKLVEEEAEEVDAPPMLEKSEIKLPKIDLENLPSVKAPERNLETESEMREVYFGALNEGFADFWGWMYTGDPDFIALSLPEYKEARTLTSGGLAPDELISLDRVYGMLNNVKENLKEQSSFSEKQRKAFYGEYRLGFKYEAGTRFSRLLKKLANITKEEREISDKDSRKFIAKSILKILPMITKQDISPEFVLQKLADVIPELREKECDYLRYAVQQVDYTAAWSCEKSGSAWQLKEKK